MIGQGVIERVWFGDGVAARIARAALAPAAVVYHAATTARNALYDRGILAVEAPPIPVLSVGNLTVGGTGKTPLTAWAAERLQGAGAHPAIVLRGYGDDEPLVHRRLNPGLEVIVDAERARAVRAARRRGADCAILDDAFQHRAIARVSDWVLIAAEQGDGGRMLPAGPLREAASGLQRADLVIVTRKSASHEQAMALVRRLDPHVAHRAIALCHLAPDALVDAVTGETTPLSRLAGRRVVAAVAIGAPRPFFTQLRALGARVDEHPFPDHHAFEMRDVERLVRLAEDAGGVAVCTLKDAVKLAPLWPRVGPSLWYVSQRAAVEHGEEALDASLDLVLAAREAASSTAGSPA